jgi:hypothetical protein
MSTIKEGYVDLNAGSESLAMVVAGDEQFPMRRTSLRDLGIEPGDRVVVSHETDSVTTRVDLLQRTEVKEDVQSRRLRAGNCPVCDQETPHYPLSRFTAEKTTALDRNGEALNIGDRVLLPWSGLVASVSAVSRTLVTYGENRHAWPCELERRVTAPEQP